MNMNEIASNKFNLYRENECLTVQRFTGARMTDRHVAGVSVSYTKTIKDGLGKGYDKLENKTKKFKFIEFNNDIEKTLQAANEYYLKMKSKYNF